MNLSIIIPALNESHNLSRLIPEIWSKCKNAESLEIIVVDGLSEDDSKEKLSQFDIKFIESDIRQRSHQMNLGVSIAKGDIYFFLHADSILPDYFDEQILDQCMNVDAGCFRMKFDQNKNFLRIYSFFTRFSHEIFHGGDASLFVKREVFQKLKGFDEGLDLMEDYEFCRRLRREFTYKVIPSYITTSARSYNRNGVIRLQWHYMMIQILFRLGASQERLISYYKQNIK